MIRRHVRPVLAALAAAALTGAAAPLFAQTGGVPSETEERRAEGMGNAGFDWNWLGLIGLFGLAGLHRRPDYHDPI